MLKLTKGQGRKVKGQGQTCNFVNKMVQLCIMNQGLNINDTYHTIHKKFKIDLRSRSNMQFCKQILFRLYTMNH